MKIEGLESQDYKFTYLSTIVCVNALADNGEAKVITRYIRSFNRPNFEHEMVNFDLYRKDTSHNENSILITRNHIFEAHIEEEKPSL